ncbi:MAG TPA: LysR family substrate-binding domain-containing protein [Nocardioidaceae bacterium]|nr:LysR family substrate-binding domain-containing protein [Nocardioidaceae bacterium]
MTSDRPEDSTAPLRVSFVPGVTPDKWARIWAERMPRVRLELTPVEESEQTAVLYDGRAEMCFVRLPVDDEGLHVIPLYSEVPVVVAAKGHFVEAADEVTLDDLSGEIVHPMPPLTAREAVETVAAGVGIVVLPMSVARLHNRKDVVHRPVSNAEETRIALAWRRDLDDERVQTFIGVVRGRKATSSRGPTGQSAPARKQPAKKQAAQPRKQAQKQRSTKGRPGKGRR